MPEVTEYHVEVHGETVETVTATETYRGERIELVTVSSPARTVTYRYGDAPQRRDEPAYSYRIVRIDGGAFRRPAGDDAAVLRKLRAGIDVRHEDAAMLPELVKIMGYAAPPPHRGIEPGQNASIHAMGRIRTGRVVKVTARKATIAFTTPSSNGRVFRKATDLVEPPAPTWGSDTLSLTIPLPR